MSQPVWEYQTLPVQIEEGLLEDLELDKRLNALGEEGWEVYAVSTTMLEGTTRFVVHHLRRLGEPKNRAGFNTGE